MDKILLVTGATSDMGMALAREIYKEYSCIHLQYRTMSAAFEQLVRDISKETELHTFQADFLSEESTDELIEDIKATGKMPNNVVHFPAPKYYNQKFHKDIWENFDKSWEIQVRSIAKILKEFIPYMSKEKYGRIVFMLSSVTDGDAPKYLSSYNTTKYALLGLMKSLASEYAEKGITVNGVSPDMVETKLLSEVPNLIIENIREKNINGKNIDISEVVGKIIPFLHDDKGMLNGNNTIIVNMKKN